MPMPCGQYITYNLPEPLKADETLTSTTTLKLPAFIIVDVGDVAPTFEEFEQRVIILTFCEVAAIPVLMSCWVITGHHFLLLRLLEIRDGLDGI